MMSISSSELFLGSREPAWPAPADILDAGITDDGRAGRGSALRRRQLLEATSGSAYQNGPPAAPAPDLRAETARRTVRIGLAETSACGSSSQAIMAITEGCPPFVAVQVGAGGFVELFAPLAGRPLPQRWKNWRPATASKSSDGSCDLLALDRSFRSRGARSGEGRPAPAK